MAATKTVLGILAFSTVLAGCEAEGQTTIGPRGGVVTSADGRVTLEIPAGALDHEVVVTVGEVDEGPEGALGTVYEIEPRFEQLHKPATITFDLAAPDIEGAESLDLQGDMNDIAVVTEHADDWRSLADHEVDADAETISASVLYFSSYAIVLR
jgi:hypothetical protein